MAYSTDPLKFTTTVQEARLGEIINSFTTVTIEDSVYVIGGYSLLAQVQLVKRRPKDGIISINSKLYRQ